MVPLSPQEGGDREKAGEWVKPEEFPSYTWAMLLVRVYEALPLVCPQCKMETMRQK
jgi:hypothetical protein